MLVSEIMTAEPISVPRDTSPREALAIMDEHDFRHLPVTAGDKLVGLVSERDLLEALGWMAGRAVDEDLLAGDRPQHVRDVMVHRPATAAPGVPLRDAITEMLARRIGCLPVLDRELRLTGILTERDVAAAYVARVKSGAIAPGADPVVEEVMSRVLICATPDTSVQDACSASHGASVRHLPVVSHGELVGVVSDRDLRAAARSGSAERLELKDLMATELETAALDERLSDAARRMTAAVISSLPVLDGSRLVGLVTLTDVLKQMERVLAA